MRVHLALTFGRAVRYGVALTSDARSTLDGDAGVGLGLGMFVAR